MFDKITNEVKRGRIQKIFDVIHSYSDCLDIDELIAKAEQLINTAACALCMIISEKSNIGDDITEEYLSKFVDNVSVEKLMQITNADRKGVGKCPVRVINQAINFDLNDQKMNAFFMATGEDKDDTVYCVINRMKICLIDKVLCQKICDMIKNGKYFWPAENVNQRTNEEITNFIDIVVEISKKINPDIDVKSYFMHKHHSEEIKSSSLVPQGKPSDSIDFSDQYKQGMTEYNEMIEKLVAERNKYKQVNTTHNHPQPQIRPQAPFTNPYSAGSVVQSAVNYTNKTGNLETAKQIMKNMVHVESGSKTTPKNIAKSFDQNRKTIECYLDFDSKNLIFKERILDHLVDNYRSFISLRNEIPAIRKYTIVADDGDHFSISGLNPDQNLEARLDFTNNRANVYCVPYSKEPNFAQKLFEYNQTNTN